MKQYLEVEIEETTTKTYKIEIIGCVGNTLKYIGANLYQLEQIYNPQGETHKVETLAIYLREDRP